MSKSKSVKVVHLITKLELGGAQINTIYTYENLNPETYETYLLTGPGGILTDRIGLRERLVTIPDLGRAINPLKDVKAYKHLKKILSEIKPDILHTHSSKAGILGRMTGKALNIPVVIHSVHGFSFSPHQSFLKRALFVRAEKWVAPKTDHFIFVSKEDIETAQKYKLVKENYSLIRSGFPFAPFTRKNPDTRQLRAQYRIEPKDVVCGIIAPFKPQKGLFHLLQVAERILKECPNALFFIAGDGVLRGALEEEIRKLGMEERFRLPGFIFDMGELLDIFDVGISTALWEGLPQSLVQMRLKKIPVVASDIAGNREVIRDGENGFLVHHLNYEEFAKKAVSLLKSDTLRRDMGEAPEELCPWDADVMVRAQEKLYLNLFK